LSQRRIPFQRAVPDEGPLMILCGEEPCR
jgi:hypothetical protein